MLFRIVSRAFLVIALVGTPALAAEPGGTMKPSDKMMMQPDDKAMKSDKMEKSDKMMMKPDDKAMKSDKMEKSDKMMKK